MTYYFTYGTSGGFPFYGGWTEIEAASMNKACSLFRAIHPDRTPGVMNCAGVYDEPTFKETEMHKKGNFGFFRKERIVLSISEEDIS